VGLALYAAISLIMYGSPLTKSYNEHIISGNEMYNDSLFDEAIVHYKRALEMDSVQSIGNFNNATNLMMKAFTDNRSKGRVESGIINESDTLFKLAYENEKEKLKKAEIMHNWGVLSHFTDSLEKAESFYKEALRNNPSDEETRYNLAVVQYLLKKDQQNQDDQQDNGGQGGGGSDNQDQQNQDQQQQQQQQQQQDQQDQQDQSNQDNQKDDKKDNEGDNSDKKDDKDGKKNDKKDGKGNGDQNKEKNSDKSDAPGELTEDEKRSKEDAERVLNALMHDEKGVLEKVNKEKHKSGKKDLKNNW
jgi:tetratricopeptide (TPR) repeat protein